MTTHGRTGLAQPAAWERGGGCARPIARAGLVAAHHAWVRPRLRHSMCPRRAPSLPLDSSPFSETAVPVATSMLGSAGELMLLMAVEPPDHVQRAESGQVIAYIDQQMSDIRQEGLGYLQGIARSISASNPDLHVTCDVEIGTPVECILIAEAERAVGPGHHGHALG